MSEKNLNIPLDEAMYERAREAKEAYGYTWPEFLGALVEVAELGLEHREADYVPLDVVVREAFEESGGASRDPPRDDPPASPPADPPTTTDAHTGDESGVTDAHREHLREQLAGSGETLEARVDAIIAMYGYLRKEGEAEKTDFLDLVDPGVVRYDSPGSVWSNMVKGKDTLSSLPGVEKPDTGLTTWRYRS